MRDSLKETVRVILPEPFQTMCDKSYFFGQQVPTPGRRPQGSVTVLIAGVCQLQVADQSRLDPYFRMTIAIRPAVPVKKC